MAKGAIGAFVQRYGAVIFFPTAALSSIYADWSYTRTWKKEQQQLKQQQNYQIHS